MRLVVCLLLFTLMVIVPALAVIILILICGVDRFSGLIYSLLLLTIVENICMRVRVGSPCRVVIRSTRIRSRSRNPRRRLKVLDTI